MKTTPVYLNSCWRPGAGHHGGRYRVNSIEDQGNGKFDVGFRQNEIHFTYDENHPPQDQQLTTASGRPLTVRAARDLINQGYYMSVGGYPCDGRGPVDIKA